MMLIALPTTEDGRERSGFWEIEKARKLICGLGSNEDGGDLVLGIKPMKRGINLIWFFSEHFVILGRLGNWYRFLF